MASVTGSRYALIVGVPIRAAKSIAIRLMCGPLGVTASGLAHSSPPEVALPIARQFIQCLLWSLLPEQGFRHSAPQRNIERVPHRMRGRGEPGLDRLGP